MSHYTPYPAYKDSGVEWLGRVPEGWEVKRLKRNLKLLTEKADRKLRPVGLENIESWTGRFIETETDFEGDGTQFDQFDILFGKLRPYLAKVYLATSPGEAVGDFFVLRPNPSMHAAFVTFQLLSREFINHVDGSTYGAKMPRVSWDFFGEVTLPTPPLAEQRSITKHLDRETARLDGLVAKKTRFIELLREKRQALVTHAITKGLDPTVKMKDSNVEWLGQVPEHWKTSALKHYWSVTDCKHLTAEFMDDGFPLASIREVQSKFVSLEDAKRTNQFFFDQLIEGGRQPLPGDLIFSRNATVGEVAQVATWHPPFAMGQDVCLMRKMDALSSSNFMQALLRATTVTEQLNAVMLGATFNRVNVEQIRNLQVAMPAPAEQDEIAAFIETQSTRLDTLIEKTERSIALIKERRAALITATVTGQIDLRAAA